MHFVGLLVAVGTAMLGCASRAVLWPNDPDSFCRSAQEQYPGLRWTELRPHDRLSTDDAVLTCGDGRVDVRSSYSFGFDLSWTLERDGLHAIVPASTLVALRPDTADRRERVQVDVISVRGRAYFTLDRDLIRQYGVWTFRKAQTRVSPGREEVFADLARITWEPLLLSHQLGPWDMLWTASNGKVEIEVVRDGPNPWILDALAVRDARGQLTMKMRIPRQMYFIVKPEHYESVKVRKVIDGVSIAKSREGVKTFFRKHGAFYGSLGEWSREAVLEWLESLKREEFD